MEEVMNAPTTQRTRGGEDWWRRVTGIMTTGVASGTEASKRRILLVDEHRALREGVREFINAQEDLVVCGVAEYAVQALAEVEISKPDAVITDVCLKGRTSTDLIKEIKARQPSLPVVVFSMHDERAYGEAARQAGADGFVVKTESPEKLLAEVRRLLTAAHV